MRFREGIGRLMPSPTANGDWSAILNRLAAVVIRFFFMSVHIQGLYKFKGLRTHPAVPESAFSTAFSTSPAFLLTDYNT